MAAKNASMFLKTLLLTFLTRPTDQFYKGKYEKPTDINIDDLKWFPPVEPPTKEYILLPYTPKDIRNSLKKKDKNSAPGYDEIVYEYLHIYTDLWPQLLHR